MTDVCKLVEEYWRHLANRDFDTASSFFTDDAIYEDLALGHTLRGRAEISAFFHEFGDAMPDARWSLTEVHADSSGYGLTWEMSGQGFPGMPAGAAFNVKGASVGRVARNKIVVNRDFYNMKALQEPDVSPET